MPSFEDAYGETSYFREHIAKLGAANARTRAAAFDRLGSSLCHQGSVYPASLAAVPLLFERLRSRGQADRDLIITLLVGIAVGDHSNFLDGTHAGKRGLKPGGPSIEARCFTAVAKRATTFRALLDERDPRVRGASAFALAWLPDVGSSKKIFTCLGREDDADARASMLISLGHLGASKARTSLVAELGAKKEVVAVGAALGLFYLENGKVPSEARVVLEKASASKRLRTKQPWNGGELAAHAAVAVAKMPRRGAPEKPTKLIASLPKMKFEQANALVVRLLKELFKGRDEKSWKSLDTDQKALLRAIVVHGLGTWRGEVDYALRARGLPWLEGLPAMTNAKRGTHPSFA